MNAYWRAANYLSVGQIYLYDNPLLREPLKLAHVKPLVVGHWGTTPGQNFIYVHLNRVIKKYDLDMFYIAGPGHGGPAIVGNVYLEGTWSEVYPNVTQDEAGLKKLFKQFSFPGGISSHVAPTTPGSIHEGGELGYSLSHAFGAAFDNPGLIVACVVGDGEAETGPLATAWQSNKFLDPDHRRRRAADPAPQRLQDQQPDRAGPHRARGAGAVLRGCGWTPYFVEGRRSGNDASADGRHAGQAIEDIRDPGNARNKNDPPAALADDRAAVAQGLDRAEGRRWPADRGHVPRASGAAAGRCRASRSRQAARKLDEELQGRGAVRREWPADAELAELAPKGDRRMGANPHANGGILLRDLRMPDFHDHAVNVPSPGAVDGQDTLGAGQVPARRGQAESGQAQFPHLRSRRDALESAGRVFEVTNRQWDAGQVEERRIPRARRPVLDSMLSEHQCEGWLEGYLLTGRHGLFNSYEAFIRIVDSMFSQHAKWLKVTRNCPGAGRSRR
jgi:xylulose-5-phosphate/fructose-6-phosphate phosphoketolase